jgi:hypothetical protein
VLLCDFNLSDETETGTFYQLFFVILSLTSLIALGGGASDLMESEQFFFISDCIKTEKHYRITNILLRTNFCQFSANIALSN